MARPHNPPRVLRKRKALAKVRHEWNEIRRLTNVRKRAAYERTMWINDGRQANVRGQ